jgi:hypothetical protein
MLASTATEKQTMRKALCGLLAFAALTLSGTAFAQEIGDKRTLAFSADRMFGIYQTHLEIDAGPFEQDVDEFELGFMWQDTPRVVPYTMPRMGVDYFIGEHLSLGGTIAYATASFGDDDDGDRSALLFAPRIGGAWMLGSVVGVWVRGGIEYFSYGEDADAHQFALFGEVPFIFKPADNWAFTVGPTFDFGFAGEAGDDNDLRTTSFGLSVGMLGWLGL